MARILVVDDRPTDRSLLVALLTSQGHEVLTASEGATALAVARRQRPDLVITDLLLPFMDGYELVRRLRAGVETTNTRVIIYSAHYDTSELEEFARVELVQSVVTKPVRPDRFVQIVEECLAADPPSATTGESTAEHLRLISQKLMQKVDALETANAEVRRLLGAVVDAQETERARIAREVHDDPIQVLSAAQLRASALRATLEDPAQIEAADNLVATLTDAVGRLRRVLWDLQPPRLVVGLAEAAEAVLHATFDGCTTTWRLDDTIDGDLDEPTRLVAFRILQEAITNAAKHSHARRVDVTFAEHDGGVRLTVADDGVGFEPEVAGSGLSGEAHLGLVSMRERAELASGWLQVRSSPGGGTVVEAWLPRGEPPLLAETA